VTHVRSLAHGVSLLVCCCRRRNGRFPSGSEKYEDESFVLPALIRFNGEPFVDDDGRLLYKFPDLQVCLCCWLLLMLGGQAWAVYALWQLWGEGAQGLSV
jgi:hypothetical protein